MGKSLFLYLGDAPSPWTSIAQPEKHFSLVIGRGQESDLILPSTIPAKHLRTVSRLHARIFRNDEGIWIEDLNSHNFTFVDAKIVFAPTRLAPPCTIRLGGVLVKMRYDDATARRPHESSSGGHRTPKPDSDDGTLHVSLGISSHFKSEFWQEVRGRVRWAEALLDVADLTVRARRAEEIEERLQALLTQHLQARSTAVLTGVSETEAIDALDRWGIPDTEARSNLAELFEQSDLTPARLNGSDGALVWLLPSVNPSSRTVSLIAAEFAAEDRERSRSDEAGALVSLSMRVAEPCILAFRELSRHRAAVKQAVEHEPSPDMLQMCARENIWGESAPFRKCLYQAEIAARRYLNAFEGDRRLSTLFFMGESGTGKSALARIIHELSCRGSQPFVELNCAAIPVTLAESELFGYERGAHDKAFTAKPGSFETARGGTLFLDEIGKTTPEFQSKLLKVLDTGCFMRLGGAKTLQTRCTVILAESEDPAELIQQGRLMPELWYRTSAFTITLPPLRNREGDIERIVNARMTQLNQRLPDHAGKRVSGRALNLLRAHDWPGNVRELMQALDVAHALCPPDAQEIEVDHLPESFLRAVGMFEARPSNGAFHVNADEPLDPLVQRLERAYFASLICQCQGNLMEVARRSGKSYQTVHTKVKALRQWLEGVPDEAHGPEAAERAHLRHAAGDYWRVLEKERA